MTDSEAVIRCQNGDRDAFRHLVDQYKDLLFGTAVLMTGNRDTAEEQVQEAFLSAWRGIRGFHRGKPVKPWFLRILINTVLSWRRKKSIPIVYLSDNEPREPDSTEGDPTETLDALERRLSVRKAIAQLSLEHRQVVALRYFAHLTVPEVARTLDIKQGTVKSRLSRALQNLRRQLEEEDFNSSNASSGKGG